MTIQEIRENIYPEDRMMAAVAAECHPKLVDHVLDGSRGHEIGKGKKIFRFLTKAAKINMRGYASKEQLADKLKSEI